MVDHFFFRTTEIEYGVVVEQLEQERQEASKRSQRLQEKVKELQKERDLALNKVSEYKSKLSEAKEGSKKELTGLQARLAKVRSPMVADYTMKSHLFVCRCPRSLLPKWKKSAGVMLRCLRRKTRQRLPKRKQKWSCGN